MRERLDALDEEEPRRPFKRPFALAQRGGVLKECEWLGGRPVPSVDGTGPFSSHNFGHGEQHLATVFACLMMLAFGIDQLRKARCPLFRAAQARKGRAKCFPLAVHDVPPAGLGHVLPGPGLRPRGPVPAPFDSP